MGVGARLFMYDVVVKSSRSLSHLLMSSSLSDEGGRTGQLNCSKEGLDWLSEKINNSLVDSLDSPPAQCNTANIFKSMFYC